MKYRIDKKLTLPELLKAAAGEFEIDVTAELLKAAGLDEDALRLGVATKSSVDDERLKTLEDKVDGLVNSLPAVIEAAVKAAMPVITAEPLNEEVMAKVKGFNPTEFTAALVGLKAEMTDLAEKTTQAVLTATAVKGEIEQVKTSVVSGTPTPEMLALIEQGQKKDVGVFGRNVLFAAQ